MESLGGPEMANPVLKISLVLTSKLTLQVLSFPTSMVNVCAGDWIPRLKITFEG